MPLGGSNDGPEIDDDEIAYEGIFKDIMGLSIQEILERGRKALFARLAAAVETGKASHQELAIFRNILRDNGLVMAPPSPDDKPPQEAPGQAPLPDFKDPEYD